jgi:hypothetical protein
MCMCTVSVKHRIVENLMHATEMWVTIDAEFGALLRDMRLWLDEHRFERSIFTYLHHNPRMAIQVSLFLSGSAMRRRPSQDDLAAR